jgi:hypothetical protein
MKPHDSSNGENNPNWFRQRASQISTKLAVVSNDIGHRLADFVNAIQQQIGSSDSEDEAHGETNGSPSTRSRRRTLDRGKDRKPCTVWLLGQRYASLPLACELGSLELTFAPPSPPAQPHLRETSNGSQEQFTHEWTGLQMDFRSRIWMTYRHQFPVIPSSQLRSDIGWGCMIRCGQSMLAQTFVMHYLGRGMCFIALSSHCCE